MNDAVNVELDVDESSLLRLLRDMLVQAAPNVKRQSTGALRNSIRIEGSSVVIGGGIVNYAVYTNEPWISPRWRGRRNPNEGWVDAVVNQAIAMFAQRYGYKVVVTNG
jgi:hypothetical protein